MDDIQKLSPVEITCDLPIGPTSVGPHPWIIPKGSWGLVVKLYDDDKHVVVSFDKYPDVVVDMIAKELNTYN